MKENAAVPLIPATARGVNISGLLPVTLTPDLQQRLLLRGIFFLQPKYTILKYRPGAAVFQSILSKISTFHVAKSVRR